MLSVRHLTKQFGTFTAVNDVSFDLAAGEIYGLLGPNGAGKTTTLSMVLGMLAPTQGEVRLFGQHLHENPFALKRRLGVMAERQSVYEEMTTWEYLMFFAHLYQAPHAAPRATTLLERLELGAWRNARLGTFSTGMLRKLGLIRALLHEPDLLILDEPVSNLDPFSLVQVREILLEERHQGRTILICSHILSEVERTADRVGIMAGGKIIMENRVEALRLDHAGQRCIEVELVEVGQLQAEALAKQRWVLSATLDQQGTLKVYTPANRDYRADLGRILAKEGAVVQGMRHIETSLEETYITVTENTLRQWAEAAHA